ncbi:tRNA epoxyqueuosine(34) reductase QueG [Limoniibacter endophyticus]|uniref:Epoxyqueuosine reductase n=1 Tax=Limoniibacter endophyticus TaxID=1565040 RepID=A0A8J3DH85_9HYPH|nr:tRNA epoxyqueuosine(34) reductase QueG [Limoniibacter endophyticus]GHC66432.1 epoxyqueuosine reductase [Limoniibacter endophyticus]
MAISQPASKSDALRQLILREAQAEGFDAVAITCADAIPHAPERLRQFLEAGRHADMEWMQETQDRRAAPKILWPEVKSIIMLGMNYGPDEDPLDLLAKRDAGAISVYARHRDYHDVIKGKLKQVAGKFAAKAGADVKVFVDTAPVMEKPLAEAAGLGWQGKHTNLVSRRFGSWLFLGSIFTNAELPEDQPERDHCGSCRACLDICPTSAFPAPYQIDARRCISYLTIENKGPIPLEFRQAIGNRIYGCDDCLSVCPWNKFASQAREAKLKSRQDLRAPKIAELLMLDDAAFRALFSGSAVKRIGRDRFIRNVLIAAGNSGDLGVIPQVERLLEDVSPLVRGASVWALSQLMDRQGFAELVAAREKLEDDAMVLDEWRQARAA